MFKFEINLKEFLFNQGNLNIIIDILLLKVNQTLFTKLQLNFIVETISIYAFKIIKYYKIKIKFHCFKRQSKNVRLKITFFEITKALKDPSSSHLTVNHYLSKFTT